MEKKQVLWQFISILIQVIWLSEMHFCLLSGILIKH